MLLAAVVGSGIMGARLSGGNVAIALLANTLATAAALVALILIFGPVSGAHFNPAVTIADATQGGVSWSRVPVYLVHGVYVLCQSRCHHGSRLERHVRGYPALRCARFHCGATTRRDGGNRAVSVARARVTSNRR